MAKLTKLNYFSPSNKFISRSRLKDYLKDKNFFYRKHVLGEIETKVTDALVIGSAVDCWLTRGEKEFKEEYRVVTKRATADKDYRYQLNGTMMEQVEEICRSVAMADAFIKLRGFKKQQIISAPMDLGMFEGICAIPDWIKFKEMPDGRIAISIVDLKTTEDAEPKKYFYKALDYGYFMQMAMIEMICELNYPNKEIIFDCWHLTVEKDPDKIFGVYTFRLAEDRIQQEKVKIREVLEDIKNEKKFARRDATWEDAILIGAMVSED